jgi:hypothetical protein
VAFFSSSSLRKGKFCGGVPENVMGGGADGYGDGGRVLWASNGDLHSVVLIITNEKTKYCGGGVTNVAL